MRWNRSKRAYKQISLPPIVTLLSVAVSASSKAFCLGSYCARSSQLPRTPSLPPPSMLAACRLPAHPGVEGVLLDVVPLQLSQFLRSHLWGSGQELALSPCRSQQPSPSPLRAASVLMESKPNKCTTETHSEALMYTKHQGYKSALHISHPSWSDASRDLKLLVPHVWSFRILLPKLFLAEGCGRWRSSAWKKK